MRRGAAPPCRRLGSGHVGRQPDLHGFPGPGEAHDRGPSAGSPARRTRAAPYRPRDMTARPSRSERSASRVSRSPGPVPAPFARARGGDGAEPCARDARGTGCRRGAFPTTSAASPWSARARTWSGPPGTSRAYSASSSASPSVDHRPVEAHRRRRVLGRLHPPLDLERAHAEAGQLEGVPAEEEVAAGEEGADRRYSRPPSVPREAAAADLRAVAPVARPAGERPRGEADAREAVAERAVRRTPRARRRGRRGAGPRSPPGSARARGWRGGSPMPVRARPGPSALCTAIWVEACSSSAGKCRRASAATPRSCTMTPSTAAPRASRASRRAARSRRRGPPC